LIFVRNKTFFRLLQRDLFSLALNPALYMSGIFFVLFCFVNFFILQRFFIPALASTDVRSFFSPMPFLSILCIPALTIGSWSDCDFSDVLPVSFFERVFSKWLSALAFFSLFLLVSAAIPFAASFFGTVEPMRVLTGFWGICCVFSALIALGQFVSLTLRSKVSAFFVSALLFSLSAFIHLIPAAFGSNEILFALCRFLSFSHHFDAAGKGIADSRDFLFYLCLTGVFLSASSFTFEKRMYAPRCKNVYKKALTAKYKAVFLFFLLCLWNSRVFYVRADLTPKRVYSLSEESKQALSALQNRLTISYYLSSELESLYPQVRDVKEFLYNYADVSSRIAVRIVRVKTDEEKRAALDAGVFPHILQSGASNSYGGMNTPAASLPAEYSTEHSVYAGIVLEYEEKRAVIPSVFTAFDAEFNIADKIPVLTGSAPEKRRPVTVLTANGLRTEEDYPYLIPWLENAGFSVNIIDPSVLEQSDAAVSVLPPTVPLLLIGSSRLDKRHCEILDVFLDSGGSMLCAVNAHEADLNTWKLSKLSENPFLFMLEKYGIFIQPPIVADRNCARIKMLRQTGTATGHGAPLDAYEEIDYPFFVRIFETSNKIHPLSKAFYGLDLFWPSHMETLPLQAQDMSILARTSAASRLQLPLTQSENAYDTDPFTASDFMPKENSETNSGRLSRIPGFEAVAVWQNQFGAAIVAVPDQYFVSRMVEYTGALYNFDFTVNALLWLSGEKALLSIKNRAVTDYRAAVSDTAHFARTLRTTLVFLCLWFFAAFGTLFICVRLYRRALRYRNRQTGCNKT